MTALRNHVALSEIITERDAAALKHLLDIKIEYLGKEEAKPGFKLIFVFSPNDFFEDTVLEKTYVYQEEVGYSGDFVYDRAIGTQIKWKEDKDLTKEFEIKKQRNKSQCFDAPYSDHALRPCLIQIPTAHGSSAKHDPRSRSSTSSPLPLLLKRILISVKMNLRRSRRSSR